MRHFNPILFYALFLKENFEALIIVRNKPRKKPLFFCDPATSDNFTVSYLRKFSPPLPQLFLQGPLKLRKTFWRCPTKGNIGPPPIFLS